MTAITTFVVSVPAARSPSREDEPDDPERASHWPEAIRGFGLGPKGHPLTTMNLHVESDAISSAGRAAHDVGLGALIGANLFAQVGWHPALREVSDERERGKVTNRAWRRYGIVNGVALGAIVVGWLGARAEEAKPSMLSDRERKLAVGKDVAVGAVALTGIASAIEGLRFNNLAKDGAVPLRDGDQASGHASQEARTVKRSLFVLGRAHLASAIALASVNAALGQANFRRPPARRLLRRRY